MPDRTVTGRRTIQASAHQIFDLLADPGQHALLSGDRSVKDSHSDNPRRLSLGARFRMRVHMVVPYWITNEVVEFEENRAIAWKHYAGHVWSWKIAPDGTDRCTVTETFDYSTTLTPRLFELAHVPRRNRRNIKSTLDRLARAVEWQGGPR